MSNLETALASRPSPGLVWEELFEEMCERIGPLIGRLETRKRAKSYIRGLLSQIDRKNGWQLAEELGERTPYSIQYFLDRSKWDADVIRDELQKYVCEKLGDKNGVGVLDETGFIKKGKKSVGVQRQYSGTAGRIENCQIGVYLSYTSVYGHTLIDRELYLPKSWTQDPERCREADIPEDVKFATKQKLAIKMVERALNAKIPIAWFAGDSIYGRSRPLRKFLEEQRKSYALAVPCTQKVLTAEKSQRVDGLAAAVSSDRWQCLSAGTGSKGPRLYHWAVIPLQDAGIAGWSHWLVIRQKREAGAKSPETAYILVFAPVDTTLQQMVEVIGDRWTVEECFQIGKSEVGLDEYEVRSWHGWYRHITLCMFAMAFLAVLRLSSQTLENPIDDGKEPSSELSGQYNPSHDSFSKISLNANLPMMVHLSIPEIQKLFYYFVIFKPLSALHRLSWSFWRRTHQALARFYHSRRRILDSPSYLPL
jgi:SRSO17 transposase